MQYAVPCGSEGRLVRLTWDALKPSRLPLSPDSQTAGSQMLVFAIVSMSASQWAKLGGSWTFRRTLGMSTPLLRVWFHWTKARTDSTSHWEVLLGISTQHFCFLEGWWFGEVAFSDSTPRSMVFSESHETWDMNQGQNQNQVYASNSCSFQIVSDCRSSGNNCRLIPCSWDERWWVQIQWKHNCHDYFLCP